jgi:hypothetical protein
MNTSKPLDLESIYENVAIRTRILSERLSEHGILTIQQKLDKIGSRQTAKFLIDYVLSRKLGGLTSSDLADTAIFANGLDETEELLNDGDIEGAFEVAKDTAMEMIQDEGGMF